MCIRDRPRSVAASGTVRDCTKRSTMTAPALPASSANSSRDSSTGTWGLREEVFRVFWSSPTRMVRSETALRSGVRYASGLSWWTGGPGKAPPVPAAAAACELLCICLLYTSPVKAGPRSGWNMAGPSRPAPSTAAMCPNSESVRSRPRSKERSSHWLTTRLSAISIASSNGRPIPSRMLP